MSRNFYSRANTGSMERPSLGSKLDEELPAQNELTIANLDSRTSRLKMVTPSRFEQREISETKFGANEIHLRPARVRSCELRHRQLLVLRLL